MITMAKKVCDCPACKGRAAFLGLVFILVGAALYYGLSLAQIFMLVGILLVLKGLAVKYYCKC